MKKLATLVLLLAGGLSAATDFSGIWNGSGSTPDPKYGSVPVNMQMTLLQAGTSLSGTVKVNNANPMKITSGSVSGSNASIVIVSNGNQQTTIQLTLNDPNLTGRVTTSTGKVYTIALKK